MPAPTAELATALRNQTDPDRAKRVGARLHERLRPNAARTLARMEIYKRLYGSKAGKP